MKALLFSSVQDVCQYIQEKKSENLGFILFSSADNVKELSLKVTSNVVLCSTAGEYTCEGYKNGVITGFEYSLEDGEAVEIMHPPIKSIDTLKKAYGKVRNNKNAFMLLLCDGLNKMEESILTTLYFIDPEFKIIGGSAGDNLKFEETLIYIGNKRVDNAALFMDCKKRTSIVKENIYTSTGKTLLVTQADIIERTVKSFNNQPASSEYARVLGINEKDLPDYFMNNPLGKVYENDILIASPMKVNNDKSITFYCELMSNTFVHLLKPEDPISILQQTLCSAPFKPSFVFAINCILRSLKFINDNTWGEFDSKMLDFCKNTTGFISYGEQYYKSHANQTMVMLLSE